MINSNCPECFEEIFNKPVKEKDQETEKRLDAQQDEIAIEKGEQAVAVTTKGAKKEQIK